MKLSQLFENTSAIAEADALLRKWREVAKSKAELTLDVSGTNASNGLPIVRKSGTWIGFKLKPMGGESREADRLTSLKVRSIFMLKTMARDLEELIRAGRKVRISNHIRNTATASGHEVLADVIDFGGTVFDTLLAKFNASASNNIYVWISPDIFAVDIVLVNLRILGVTGVSAQQGLCVSMSKTKMREFLALFANMHAETKLGVITAIAKKLGVEVAPHPVLIVDRETRRKQASMEHVTKEELVRLLGKIVPGLAEVLG